MKKFPINKALRHLFIIVSFYWIAALAYAENPVIIPDVKLKTGKTKPALTQFTKVEIEKSPVTNLSQFLKQEQSVVRLTNNSGDASQTALSLRGFGDNAAANSLILIDGFPLTNPSLIAPNFNSIPLTDIERLEIIQGSSGSLRGNQAVGGVVNIITKHPKKFFINSILSLGSYQSYYENILLGDKKENGFFYKVFGVIAKTNNYRDHNQQKANNVAAQIGKDYARGTISLNVQSYADSIYFPGGLSEEQFAQNPQQATDFNNHSQSRTNLFQLLSKHELNNNWLLETRVNQQTTQGDGFIYFDFNRNDSLTNFSPRLIGTIKNNKWIFGYDGQISRYQLSNSKVQAKTSATQNDIYFQTTVPLSNTLDFVLGARKSWQANQINPQPSITNNYLNQVFVTEQSLLFHPSDSLSFYLRRDGNFSFPKANEVIWVPDNVNALQAQTGTSYETGMKWQTEKNKSELNFYRLQLHNEIAFNPTQTPTQPFGAFNNLDETRRYGVTFSENYRITPKLALNGQINYVNAKFASGSFSGNSIPAVPAINGNAGINYAFTEHWAAQYTLLYTGSRYASEDVENVGKKVPGYFLNDAALQYMKKAYSINFEVHNLFNKNYANYVFYNSFTQQNIYYPAAGRNYFLTLKINID